MHKRYVAIYSRWSKMLELCTNLARWVLLLWDVTFFFYANLGGLLLTVASVVRCLSSDTSFVKDLMRQVRFSNSHASFSFTLLIGVWYLLPVYLESLTGSSSTMTLIELWSFSTSIASWKFSKKCWFRSSLDELQNVGWRYRRVVVNYDGVMKLFKIWLNLWL